MKFIKATLFSLFLAGFSQVSLAQITSVTPNQGNRGQTLPIIISGATGTFSQGTNTNVWLQQGSFTIGPGTSTNGSVLNVAVLSSTDVSADVSIPQNAPLGMYDVAVWNQGTMVVGGSFFEVKGGTSTNVSLKVGGGKPGDVVNEEVLWTGIDLTGQSIEKMWLSKDGQTITSLTNPSIVLKDTKVGVTIQIPTSAISGYWNANLVTNTGQLLMSPAAFLVDATFAVSDYELKGFSINVYPNPASEVLKVNYGFDNFKSTQIRVLDIQGRVVMIKTQHANEKLAELNVTNLSSGTYFLQVLEGSKVLSTNKWVKD